jgi:hypothetical protein
MCLVSITNPAPAPARFTRLRYRQTANQAKNLFISRAKTYHEVKSEWGVEDQINTLDLEYANVMVYWNSQTLSQNHVTLTVLVRHTISDKYQFSS